MFSATITPADAKQAVTWWSTNESVLKFEDENSGNATIVDVGEATITATATDGSNVKSAPHSITITPDLAAGNTIDDANEKVSTINGGYDVSKITDFAKLLKTEALVDHSENLFGKTTVHTSSASILGQ